jgi:hypothetical protein
VNALQKINSMQMKQDYFIDRFPEKLDPESGKM